MQIPILLLVIVSACGRPTANPCATKSATYIQRFTTTSGNCGNLPDQVVNIAADGSIPAAKDVTCDVMDADGCTQRNTNCRGPAVNGVTCTANTSLTFESDGSRASGSASVTCTGAASCSGSYGIVAIRQ